MNIYLQIGIGLLPGTIAAVFFLFKRKAFQFKKITAALLLLLACGGTAFLGIRDAVLHAGSTPRLSRNEMIAFANALALEGAYDETYEVLDQYSSNYGYDNDCRLLTARVRLLQGDYDSACGLYRYLLSDTDLLERDAAEIRFAEGRAGTAAADLAMMQYLDSIGENIEDYGYSEDQRAGLKDSLLMSIADIRQEIMDEIEDAYPIDGDLGDCAQMIREISGTYTDQANATESDVKKYKRALASLKEDHPGLFSLVCVKKAEIKARILTGDFDAVTENLNAGSTYHELLVAAELYMNGLVKKSDFPEDYRILGAGDAEAIQNQMNIIYRKAADSLSRTERQKLRARISAISDQLNDTILATMKNRLTGMAGEAGTDKTKVYLALAKIEDYFGNETATDSYLREAIYSSQDCTDDNYVHAMSQILHVINNDEDSDLENIKKVSDYVETVLDNSLTVDVERIISSWRRTSSNPRNGLVEVAEDHSNFSQTAVDFVSRTMNVLTIGRIDVENFPSITSRIQVSSDYLNSVGEIRQALKVYDCGAEITDFTLEKLEYSCSNIILLCDVSGSMSGCINDLQNAVLSFIENKSDDENLSIVTFSSSITGGAAFGSTDEELKNFAASMRAYGGTNIFSSVLNCLESFPGDDTANNVLIVMTDGQDGNRGNAYAIRNEIGALAQSNGVTIYTIGLSADVDTAYLNSIAESGNGEFVYVSDSSSLSSFYNMLHQQVNHQYSLTYEALDTMSQSGRTLEITIPSEKARDIRNYHIGSGEEDGGLQISQGLSLFGLSPRYVYKGSQDVEVRLNGTGFNKDDLVTVKLNGNIDYTLNAEYVDPETYKLTIPASIAVGTYHVEVSLGGKKKVFQNGFSVIVQGSEQKTEFGPYVFTSAGKAENDDGSLTLYGAVTLNGWLHFKGNVSLTGDLANGDSIRVSDDSGSYVTFDTATAEGIGAFFAEKGIPLDIPALHQFTLYNDPLNVYDYTKYRVADIATGPLQIHQLAFFDSPKIRLYPNSIGLYYSTGTTILPYQDKIIKGAEDMFKFRFDGSAQITDKNIGIILDASYNDPQNSNYGHSINLLNSPVYFNGSIAVKLNTLTNEYTLGAMVRLAFFAKQSGLGAEVSWKGHLVPDSVKLQLELAQAVKLPTAFPIEVNNFSFQVSEINEAIEKGSFLSLKYTGSASFSSMKVEEYLPPLGKVLGDMSLLEMPDTTASIRLSPLQLEADATLMFLSEIKLAEANVKLGNFDYTNTLLQLDSVNVNGLSAGLKVGIMWETADGRVKLELSGRGEIDAHSRFVGIDMSGTASYDIGWWIIRCDDRITGEFALGLYTTHNDKHQFVFAYKTQSGGKVKGKFYYIDENGHCGKNNGTLS